MRYGTVRYSGVQIPGLLLQAAYVMRGLTSLVRSSEVIPLVVVIRQYNKYIHIYLVILLVEVPCGLTGRRETRSLQRGGSASLLRCKLRTLSAHQKTGCVVLVLMSGGLCFPVVDLFYIKNIVLYCWYPLAMGTQYFLVFGLPVFGHLSWEFCFRLWSLAQFLVFSFGFSF